jgi:hypothetical protein
MRRRIAKSTAIMYKTKGNPIAVELSFSRYRYCIGFRRGAKNNVPKIKTIINALAKK